MSKYPPPKNRRKLGIIGEQWARAWLQAQGYEYVAHNVYSRWGELDLVMKEGNTLVFVEVKLRHSDHRGSPLEAITPYKQQKVLQAAQYYLLKHPYQGPIRFDALGIQILSGAEPHITHIKDAIQYN